MNFSDFPFLRYLPFFLGGILISKTVPELPWQFFFPCVFLLWVIYALRIRISNPFSPTWSGVLAYLILFVLGLTLGLHHKKSHTPTLDWEGVDSYLAEVSGFDIPKANSSENLVEVLAVRACGTWQKNSGKVLF
jgi:competence protein ComEC